MKARVCRFQNRADDQYISRRQWVFREREEWDNELLWGRGIWKLLKGISSWAATRSVANVLSRRKIWPFSVHEANLFISAHVPLDRLGALTFRTAKKTGPSTQRKCFLLMCNKVSRLQRFGCATTNNASAERAVTCSRPFLKYLGRGIFLWLLVESINKSISRK